MEKLTREQELEIYRLGKILWDEAYKDGYYEMFGIIGQPFLCYLYGQIYDGMHEIDFTNSSEIASLLPELSKYRHRDRSSWFNDDEEREEVVYNLAAIK